MSERFKITSLTGYPIAANGKQSASKQGTEWYVLDRAWNHRIVARYKSRTARQRAERCAATLNREHET